MRFMKVLWLIVIALLPIVSTGLVWAQLNVEITDIELGPAPRLVQVHTSLDSADIPLSAFSVYEEGVEMTLVPGCDTTVAQPIDVCFVIDRSRSMEDNIDSVVTHLVDWITSIPGQWDFQFGLVLYGQQGPPAFGCPPGPAYAGGPRNASTTNLLTDAQLIGLLEPLTVPNSLLGGQEPANHAMWCALENTAWRDFSRKYVVLVTDENNDTCQWHGAIPYFSNEQLIANFNARNTELFVWCNDSIQCDCYDDCVAPYPPCNQLVPYGCVSGFDDFSPIAFATGGGWRSIHGSIVDLLNDITEDILNLQWLCYYSPCCYPGQPRTVRVEVEWGGESDWDELDFIRETCWEQFEPVIACWPGNPTEYTPGVDLTVCVIVSDEDINLQWVKGYYNLAGHQDTLLANLVDGRYCITIPGDYLVNCDPINVGFMAQDLCTTVYDTCVVAGGAAPPVVDCWTSNPAFFTWAQNLSVCATTTDPDNNVTGVTGRYTIGQCDATLNATLANGRWCITVPGNCLTVCQSVRVIFTATDACGDIGVDTCWVAAPQNPPLVTCWTGNDPTYEPGLPHTMCATVTDLDGNVQGVTGRYIVNGFDQTLPASLVDGRYCITIPAVHLLECLPGMIIFTATDLCGITGADTCFFTAQPEPPVVDCWGQNPGFFTWNTNLSMCAVVTDDNVTGVTGRYTIGTCNATVNATLADGRWCITVPGNCLTVCQPVRVIFTATDACGGTGVDTCWANPPMNPPVVDCWTGNPGVFTWNTNLSMCATVTDLDNNVQGVTGRYTIGTCNATVNATLADGRWCITVPGNCLTVCQQLRVIFTATDVCGVTGVDTCYVNFPTNAPTITCWDQNPIQFVYNQPLQMCAVATDLDNNIQGVTGRYVFGTCDQTVAATLSNGRWCITVPASCTMNCENDGMVIFTVTDACGTRGYDTCYVNAPPPPAQIQCEVEAVLYGAFEDVTVCVIPVGPPPHNITSVTAHYNTLGLCDVTEAAVDLGNRWCVTVPATCLMFPPPSLEVVPEFWVYFTAENACGTTTDSCYAFRDILPRYDLGDLPNPPYPTNTAGGGGPAHLLGDLWLGSEVDNEDTPHHDFEEDNGMAWDCETQMRWDNCAPFDLPITVTADPALPGPYYLSGWFDWNDDGDFLDEYTCGDEVYSEWFIQDVVVVNGVNLIPVVVDRETEDGLIDDSIHVRLRLDTYPFGALGFDDVADIPPPDRPDYWPRFNGEVEDYGFVCEPEGCCEYCVILPPQTMMGLPVAEYEAPMNAVIQIVDGAVRLTWNAVPGAAYYNILTGDMDDSPENMQVFGSTLEGQTSWRDPRVLMALPTRQIYRIQPMHVAVRATHREVDRGRWEMDNGSGQWVHDASGNGFDGLLWPACPPDWGQEPDTCEDLRGFTHFEAFAGHPGCGEHIRVENNDIWYGDAFQLTTCIRIFEEPTIQTGPYYIISNNSFATMHGGFMLRIDPAWIWVNGVREYHNRLTAMVWNETLGNWMTIQSPPPNPADPTRWSVPLNQWVEIAWVVDGDNSLLIINDRVVAVGEQWFISDNNGAPLIIGAGWRHHTYPIEYPFRGDIDCIRIVGINDN